MAKLLLIVCAIFACGLLPVYAQTPAPNSPSSSPAPAAVPGATTAPTDGPSPPPARLITKTLLRRALDEQYVAAAARPVVKVRERVGAR